MLTDQQLGTGVLVTLALGLGGAALLRHQKVAARTKRRPYLDHTLSPVDPPPTVRAARRLNRAAGLIATSTLLDSAIEHYRGSFQNKAMYTPLIVSALTLAVSAHGTADSRPAVHKTRDAIYLAAALTGFIGTGFHIYNVSKRPGGFSWQNLFYGSPLGAPAAVALSGLLGYYSERLRENESGKPVRVFGLRAGRALAALSSAGMAATAAEAGLLHFRGAFHDPFMYAPVTAPPLAAALLAETAGSHPKPPRRLTRWWLRLTALMGFAGAGFHIYGVSRNMGGWRNWRQNVLNGPPIPAPPSFTGLAFAGLAALSLLEEHDDA
ncbi:hypothetical protein [Nitrosococcus watsonii]|uniref:Uncharacterized protein n=1 Tax=Nitrosococcus watsoni (strain C-113) TaxID=105559 RepID=D8KAJ3_NITWC|nr:hypothetical protein [Nitrosococcus watsonii]ADJ29420.1 conserved hypothetical protein [Nitrosococcus watsonii C-113]